MNNMRAISIFLISISLMFVSCDKQKQTAKSLEGEWEITSYKLTDIEGMSEYAAVQGSLIFDYCKDVGVSCSYSINITHAFPSSTGNTINNGTYQVIEKGDFMNVTTLDQNNDTTSTYKYRILTQTKTDLQLEYADTLSRFHSFIFKKKK